MLGAIVNLKIDQEEDRASLYVTGWKGAPNLISKGEREGTKGIIEDNYLREILF